MSMEDRARFAVQLAVQAMPSARQSDDLEKYLEEVQALAQGLYDMVDKIKDTGSQGTTDASVHDGAHPPSTATQEGKPQPARASSEYDSQEMPDDLEHLKQEGDVIEAVRNWEQLGKH